MRPFFNLSVICLSVFILMSSCKKNCEDAWPHYNFAEKDYLWMEPYQQGQTFIFLHAASGITRTYTVTSVVDDEYKNGTAQHYKYRKSDCQENTGYFTARKTVSLVENNKQDDFRLVYQREFYSNNQYTTLDIKKNAQTNVKLNRSIGFPTTYLDSNEPVFSNGKPFDRTTYFGELILTNGKKYTNVYAFNLQNSKETSDGQTSLYPIIYLTRSEGIIRIDEDPTLVWERQ